MKRYRLILKHPQHQMIISGVIMLIFICMMAVVLISRKIAAESALMTIHERTETITWPIDYEVQQVKSYVHDIGYTEVKQAGIAGERQLTYTVKTRDDGVELDRIKTSEAVTKEPTAQIEIIGAKLPNALTKARGAQHFVDSNGVIHRETYYDLPMNIVIGACGGGGYTVREDGAKVDKDGYILVAANYGNYPRCSVVETSMGPGKVYDTGGFAVRHPHGFDLATDWTKADGR